MIFWFATAALALTGVAILMLWPALTGRRRLNDAADAAAVDHADDDADHTVTVPSKLAAIVVAATIPLAAAGLYLALGTPAALTPTAARPTAPPLQTLLWLAALEAESRQDYRQALAYLHRLLPLLADPNNAEVKKFIAWMKAQTTTADE